MKIGINGFGRIGRALFRVNLEKKGFEVSAINEINPDVNNLVYMLNYDTTYGTLNDKFALGDDDNVISNSEHSVRVLNCKSIDEVDWDAHQIDIVVDASGVKANLLAAKNVIKKNKSVKKVVITHSPEEVDFTMILGVNEDELDVERHNIISSSICDATAMAPVLKILQEQYGIDYAAITTVHPLLSYQNVVDGQSDSWFDPGHIYGHYPLGRSVFNNIIPKPTTSVTAACKVLKNVNPSQIASFSYRTPTTIVASADMSVVLKEKTSLRHLREVFEGYENDQRWEIIHNESQPLVSLDYRQSPYSAIVDNRWLQVIDGKLLKIVLWYDNEWGYASRVVDQLEYVFSRLER